MPFLRFAFPSFLLLACAACTSTSRVGPPTPIDGLNLPPVAAEYETTVRDTGARHSIAATRSWRVWRNDDLVTTEDLAARTGEVWQRDGQEMFHQRLYHADRRGIEFQPDDLRMVSNARASWPVQALGIDPALLASLELTRMGSMGGRDGYPYQRYEGTSGTDRWKLVVRTDLMLPVLIERRGPGVTETTQLKRAFTLATAPWVPTPSDAYELIDFADLGDRENDPFVTKVERDLGRPHTH
jgi:hypothetical protein